VIHRVAAEGFSAGVEAYRRARPTYHPELVARFIERYGAGHVIELGAGTGLFTAALVAAGVDVTPIEPIPEMRAALANTLPDLEPLAGTAEAIPIDDATADTVVAAQSAHWFTYPDALDEIGRILRPGGHYVTVWNVQDETVPWVAAFTNALEQYAGNTPRHRTMRWRSAVDADPRFSAVDDWGIPNPQSTTPDGVVERALSTSFIAALPEAEQAKVSEAIRRIVATLGDSFEYPYLSEVQAWRRA
jgi:SAM-dependent methyltransferase